MQIYWFYELVKINLILLRFLVRSPTAWWSINLLHHSKNKGVCLEYVFIVHVHYLCSSIIVAPFYYLGMKSPEELRGHRAVLNLITFNYVCSWLQSGAGDSAVTVDLCITKPYAYICAVLTYYSISITTYVERSTLYRRNTYYSPPRKVLVS